jgi:CRP-like cAMP-binding protein
MALRPCSFAPGETIITAGDPATDMYLLCRGSVSVTDPAGVLLQHLHDGDCFGEIGLLMSTPRTAHVKALCQCDLLVLEKSAFCRIMQENPQFADSVIALSQERYNITVRRADLVGS